MRARYADGPNPEQSALQSRRRHMNTRFMKDALGWGIVLWVIGYALGIMYE